MNTKTNHKDTSLLPGLDLQSREDGVWLSFDSGGKKALINLANIAKESGSIVKEAMLEWLTIYATS